MAQQAAYIQQFPLAGNLCRTHRNPLVKENVALQTVLNQAPEQGATFVTQKIT